jgi:hypothetical protein
MQTPLEIIGAYGVSTTSFIKAIQEFNDPERPIFLSKTQYERGIANIIGGDHPPLYANEKEARIYFLYVIQETIRAFQHGIPEMDQVWEEAQRRAKAMIERQPWAVKDYNTTEDGEPKMDAVGNPKKRKGAKKEEAEALFRQMNDGTNSRTTIIAALVDEIGMSKAGATTYFHNLKKQYGFKGPKEVKPVKQASTEPRQPKPKIVKAKKTTKADIARQVFVELKDKPKDVIIEAIIEKTGTTRAGANTYYCGCKKEFGV